MSELLDTINCPRCGLGIDVHVPSRQVEAREAEVGQWAATVDRVTRERDDEHLARAKAEAKVERLNAAWNECSADKHRLLKEARALDAEIERLREENEKYSAGMQENCQLRREAERLRWSLGDAMEVLGYRDRDIEKFRKGTLAFTAEVERLKARERELVAHLDYRETIEPFMEDLAVLLNGSPTTDAQLLSEAIFEIESLRAAVSAGEEDGA